MSSSAEAILIIAILAIVLLAVSMISHNRTEKEKFIQKSKKSWGGGNPPKYTDEAFRSIRLFSDYAGQNDAAFSVDDITWNDSDMDNVFLKINRTLSSPGEDVLYAWLRHPLLTKERLNVRDALITRLGDNEELRNKVSGISYRIGRGKKNSYFEDALKAAQAPREGSGKYIFLCILTIVSIALLFVQPVAGICVLVADFIVNITVRMRSRTSCVGYIRGFREIIRTMRGAEQLMGLDIPEAEKEKKNISKILKEFEGFRKGAFWVTGAGSVGTGIGDAILEYINLFFHLDMIQYDRMAAQIKGKESELFELMSFTGMFDAAVSAASFRKLLKNWCRPELNDGARGFVKAEELYHPLLEHPVKNDICTEGGNLITGANASGKSTFLKSVSIGAILAQSIATVPAKSWKSSFFRVYTSMALNDNLSGGESYFVVEIRSLKRIMDASNAKNLPETSEEKDFDEKKSKDMQVPVLGMIDEVLRGTNTIERIAASAQVLKHLNDGNSLIFAATHDIELTQILEKIYHNYHFSGKVEDGDVRFDYTIKEGPTRERNAIALMEAAGYDKELAENAEECARHFEETGEWTI